MIDIELHGPIREIRMNRPPANALSPELVRQLTNAVSDGIECGCGALVLSGLPGMFSGGLDVPALITMDRDGIREAWSDFFDLLRTIARSPIPIVAAITGHSPAGGAVISLFCDYRVMAEGRFSIGLNEVQVGIVIPPFMLAALRRLVGIHQAGRMGSAALMLSPEEALTAGLVDELAAPDEVVGRALTWCQRLVSLPPHAMQETRAWARADLVELFDSIDDRYLDELVDLWFSDETQAALSALVERLKAG